MRGMMPGGAPRKLKDGKVRSVYLDHKHWAMLDSIAAANSEKLGRVVNASEVLRKIIETNFTIQIGAAKNSSYLTDNSRV